MANPLIKDSQGLSPRNADLGAALAVTGQAPATVNGPDVYNASGRGVIVVVKTANIAGGASVAIHIQGKDVTTGAYYDLLVSAAILTNTNTVLIVYPGAPVTTNVSANSPVPLVWRVQAIVTVGGTVDITAGANVIC